MSTSSNPYAWRKREEPILDSLILAAIASVNDACDETGVYSTLRYTGCSDYPRAQEIKRALYRSVYHVNKNRNDADKISMSYEIIRDADDSYALEYTVRNKRHARAHVTRTYGSDRSKWPYDPRRRKDDAA